MPSASARLGRWLKPAGTIALYVFVFYWTDARAILGRLRAVELSPLVAGILIYAAGQAVSTFKWRLLIAPLELAVYSLGLGVPFLLTALAINQFFAVFARIRKHYHAIEVGSGLLLCAIGVLIFTDRFTIIARWLSPYLPTL